MHWSSGLNIVWATQVGTPCNVPFVQGSSQDSALLPILLSLHEIKVRVCAQRSTNGSIVGRSRPNRTLAASLQYLLWSFVAQERHQPKMIRPVVRFCAEVDRVLLHRSFQLGEKVSEKATWEFATGVGAASALWTVWFANMLASEQAKQSDKIYALRRETSENHIRLSSDMRELQRLHSR